MYCLNIFTTFLLTAMVVARPITLQTQIPSQAQSSPCLQQEQAYSLAQDFIDLISKPFNTTLVETQFTSNFQDYSDSVAELMNHGCSKGEATLTAPTFPSRQAYIAGQSSQKPIPMEMLNVWYNCNSITVRWRAPNPAIGAPTAASPPQVVTGILVLEVVHDGMQFLVERTFSEFNSGAWLYDLGMFQPQGCPP